MSFVLLATGNWLLHLKGDENTSVRAALVRTLVGDPKLALSTIALSQIGWATVIAMSGDLKLLPLPALDLSLWLGRCRLRHRIGSPGAGSMGALDDAALAVINVGWSIMVALQVVSLMQFDDLRALVLALMLSLGERSYTGTLYAAFPRLSDTCAAISTVALTLGLAVAFHPHLVVMVPIWLALSIAFVLLGRRAHENLIDAIRAQQMLHRQSRTDPLTGLGNRLAKSERLAAMFEDAKLSKRFGSLLYIDLDGFKDVNDRYGHPVGDFVLIEVGHRLSDCVRGHGLVYRIGGDEFVILLADMDELSLRDLAANVVSSIHEPIAITTHFSACVGASVGIATMSYQIETPSKLLQSADAALYAAKRNGKGHFVIAP